METCWIKINQLLMETVIGQVFPVRWITSARHLEKFQQRRRHPIYKIIKKYHIKTCIFISCKNITDVNFLSLRILLHITFPALSTTVESQNISLRSTSLMMCFLPSLGLLQYVSFSHVSSTGFHSSCIHCLYHRSSQSHIKGLPNEATVE